MIRDQIDDLTAATLEPIQTQAELLTALGTAPLVGSAGAEAVTAAPGR